MNTVTWIRPECRLLHFGRPYSSGVHRVTFTINNPIDELHTQYAGRSREEYNAAVRQIQTPLPWTPQVGFIDAYYIDTVPTSQYLGDNACTFGYHSNGLFACNQVPLDTKHPFSSGQKVTLELNMERHCCLFYIDDKPLPFFVSQLPNAVYLAAGMSAKGSSVTVEKVESGNIQPSITPDMQEFPFNPDTHIPSFVSPSDPSILIQPPDIADHVDELGYRPYITTADWTAPLNATVFQRVAFYSTHPVKTTRSPQRYRLQLSLLLPQPPSQRQSVPTSLDALTVDGTTWNALIGLCAVSHSPPDHDVSHDLLGMDDHTCALTAGGYLVHSNRICNASHPFNLTFTHTDDGRFILPLTVILDMQSHIACFCYGHCTKMTPLAVITDIPDSVRIAVCYLSYIVLHSLLFHTSNRTTLFTLLLRLEAAFAECLG